MHGGTLSSERNVVKCNAVKFQFHEQRFTGGTEWHKTDDGKPLNHRNKLPQQQ